MAIWKHPIAGVELNVISKKRPYLNREDAVAVHILRFEGTGPIEISQLLGTNPARVDEAIKGTHFPGAAETALSMMIEARAIML